MTRKLPPFPAIRAFEAAARHLSVKQAADELCVTPSAVSHQIRTLEEYLGRQLFLREANQLSLTLAGRHYLDELTPLLDALDLSTQRVTAGRSDRALRILSTPAFAARWLVPRLDRSPEGSNVSVRVSTGAPSTDFARNDADLVLHWGDAPVSGVTVLPLMQSARFPVASPAFVDQHDLRAPRDLLDKVLIHDEVGDAWGAWFECAGLKPPAMPCGPRFPHCELTMTAAERGQGLCLAYDAMVRGTLAEGRLVRLFEKATLPLTIYSVAYPVTRADDPRIRAFRDWLFDEVAAEGTGIEPGKTRAKA